jgi:hypothetical protein
VAVFVIAQPHGADPCFPRVVRDAELEQFNAKTHTFTPPKNGLTREAPLTDPAREAITALPVESEFCFAPIRGEHWTASARAYHWKAVKGCG